MAVTEEGRDGGEAAGFVTGLSTDLAGQMQDFYYVIVSADGKGYWTQVASGEVYTTATEPVSAVADVTSLLSGDYTAWSTGPTPVPEPTSGLLIVLGMAGLMLRRRHA